MVDWNQEERDEVEMAALAGDPHAQRALRMHLRLDRCQASLADIRASLRLLGGDDDETAARAGDLQSVPSGIRGIGYLLRRFARWAILRPVLPLSVSRQ